MLLVPACSSTSHAPPLQLEPPTHTFSRPHPAPSTHPHAVNRIVNGQLPASAVVDYKVAALIHLPSPADQSAEDLQALSLAGSGKAGIKVAA